MTANCSPLPWDTVQMMMIMMGGGWSSREAEAERDSRATGESGGEESSVCRPLFSRERERERAEGKISGIS